MSWRLSSARDYCPASHRSAVVWHRRLADHGSGFACAHRAKFRQFYDQQRRRDWINSEGISHKFYHFSERLSLWDSVFDPPFDSIDLDVEYISRSSKHAMALSHERWRSPSKEGHRLKHQVIEWSRSKAFSRPFDTTLSPSRLSVAPRRQRPKCALLRFLPPNAASSLLPI